MEWLNTRFLSNMTFLLFIFKAMVAVLCASATIVIMNIGNVNLEFYVKKIFAFIKAHRR